MATKKIIRIFVCVFAILLTACSSSGEFPGGPPDLGPAGTDASLSSLSLTGATLDPMFSPPAASSPSTTRAAPFLPAPRLSHRWLQALRATMALAIPSFFTTSSPIGG